MHLTAVTTFLKQMDELATAKTLLDTFAKYANGLEQFDELGMLYEKIKCYHDSLAMLQKCMSIANNDQLYNIRANMAKVYNHLNDPHKSLIYSGVNLELNPGDPDTTMEQSFSYYLMGNGEKSYDMQRELLSKDVPNEIKKRIMFNMGTFQMERGQFKEGLRNMIMGGRGLGIWPPSKRPYPKWDGNPTDSTIIVYAEAGMGDEIINVRFMHELKKRGYDAIYVSLRKDLAALFSRSGINAVDPSVSLDPIGDYVYIEAMSLPIYLELDAGDLWSGPYLTADPGRVELWRGKLPERFLTVRWSGNPYYDQDLHRFIDRETLVNGLSTLGLPLVSLQIDKKGSDPRLIDVDVQTWDDTLAIQQLALHNITSCTSTAHSAGAAGYPTVVLPPIATYYPWVSMRDSIHSWWYGDSTVAFPQRKHKNWEDSVALAVDHVRRSL